MLVRRLQLFLVTCLAISATARALGISPCPALFAYENMAESEDAGQWYGVVRLFSMVELRGVEVRVALDKAALQLGNWFGEVTTEDNRVFVIKNKDYVLEANNSYQMRFYVKFDPKDPVEIASLQLNGRKICPVDKTATTTIHPKPPETIPDCGTIAARPLPLISMGVSTFEGEFPWHAAIYASKMADLVYNCGGSLISGRHVITVAHCVAVKRSKAAARAENLVVYFGKYYLKNWSNSGIQARHVEKVFIHPDYNPETYGDDLGVLKLVARIEITDFVRPVCLWDDNNLDSIYENFGSVVGWGLDETGKISEKLMEAKMPVVSRETCIYSFPDFFSKFTTEKTFCAGFRNGTSVCNGDSGGGMVFPRKEKRRGYEIWQLRGLVSISIAKRNEFKCDTDHFVVFTDVAKYLGWIKGLLRT